VGTSNSVYGLCKSQDGDVVIQRSGVELRVDVDCRYVTFLIRVELDVMVHIPFTKPYPQVMPVVPATRRSISIVILNTMGNTQTLSVPLHAMKAYV
jgi:hypothetical protein